MGRRLRVLPSFPALPFGVLGPLGSSPVGLSLSLCPCRERQAVLAQCKILGSLKSWHQECNSCYQCLFSGGKVRPLDAKKGELNVGDLKDSRSLGGWQSETSASWIQTSPLPSTCPCSCEPGFCPPREQRRELGKALEQRGGDLGLSPPFWKEGSLPLDSGQPTSQGLLPGWAWLAPLAGLNPFCSCGQIHPALSRWSFLTGGVPSQTLDLSPWHVDFIPPSFKMYVYGVRPSHITIKGEHLCSFTVKKQTTFCFSGANCPCDWQP